MLSTLLLRQSLIDPTNNNIPSDSPFRNAIQIAFGQTALLSGSIQIQARMPIDEKTSLISNLDIINNAYAFSNYQNNLNNIPVSASSVIFQGSVKNAPMVIGLKNIPLAPSYVISLEQYFLWAVFTWSESLAKTAQQAIANQTWTSKSGSGGSGGTATSIGTTVPINYLYNQSSQVNLNLIGGNSDYSNCTVNLTLPFEWHKWLNSNNIIESVINLGVI